MGFLPQLLNWQTAAIAGAVAVPALLLLYFLKLRRVPQPVGSTILWKKAIQDLQVNSPFQRLRRNILLLLQMLALLALLLALARPVSEGASVAGEKTVILLDRSASMNATDGEGGVTRLEEAKERAKALVNTMGRGAQATVVSFDDTARVLQPYTGDAALLRAAIDDVTPSDRPTRLATAYTLADANMGANAAERLRDDAANRADVFLFSDGRVPSSDAGELSLRGSLTYEKIGTDAAQNLAVVAASVKRNYEEPTRAQVFARVDNFGPDVATAGVRVSVADYDEDADDGGELIFEPIASLPAPVTVPPARWTDPQWRQVTEKLDPARLDKVDQELQQIGRRDSVDVTLELPRSAVVKIELVDADDYSQPVGDALPSDDAAFVVVPPPEPVRAALVTEGNYYLELLLRTQRLEDPQVTTPQEYQALLDSGGAAEFDVTIFDNYSPPTLPPAGTFVYSGGLPPEDATNVTAVTNEQDLPLFYEANAVLDWDREHPMLRGLGLSRLWVSEGRLLTVPLGGELLIEGDRGPMLILERNGPRTHLIFSFDLTLSTWPRQKTFPIFGYQMFAYLAAAEDVRVRESVRPGELVAVPRSLVDRANLGENGEVAVVGPAGTRDAVPQRRTTRVGDAGTLTMGPFERAGVYRTEPPVPQFGRVAVSLLDASESNLLPAYTDPGNLSGADLDAVAEDGSLLEASGVRDVEWWWWLVAAAAVVLTIEWFVYTRRVGA